MIEAIRLHAGEITLMCIAPLTNVAIALQRARDRLHGQGNHPHGGSADQGNHTAAAEFNIFADPKRPMWCSAPASRCACSA
jgi:purine nucleosidase